MNIPKKYKKTALSIDAWYAGYTAGEKWAMKTFRVVLRPKDKREDSKSIPD